MSSKAKKAYYKHVLNREVDDKEAMNVVKYERKKLSLKKQMEGLKNIKKEFSKTRPKILIVDDEPHIINLIKLSLQDEYDIIVANSGNEAIHVAEEQRPDLVTMDIMMPGMSGFEVVEEMRKFESTKEIPVIFLSAKDTLKDMQIGMETGGDDFITKPFEPEELNRRIKEHLKK
ncbi:response regulator [Candidatus Woesearchaeota archaeon]|nr:response regulator [Candidatus Woesearchaeota archaeon]